MKSVMESYVWVESHVFKQEGRTVRSSRLMYEYRVTYTKKKKKKRKYKTSQDDAVISSCVRLQSYVLKRGQDDAMTESYVWVHSHVFKRKKRKRKKKKKEKEQKVRTMQ